VLYRARGRRTFVDRHELECDSRSDVTNNDATVTFNDILDGVGAATRQTEKISQRWAGRIGKEIREGVEDTATDTKNAATKTADAVK
jgi:hypothetical protein